PGTVTRSESGTVPDQRCTVRANALTLHRIRDKRAEMDPKEHAAIVTGAASGLGAETAAALAKAGAKVACLDVNLDGATQVASKIGGIAVHCDVTSDTGAVAALKQARDKHG